MDYIDYEKDEFGMGKEYTSTMIDIWNGRVDGVNYGEQDDYDMWGVIQNKIYDKNRKISLVCTFQE
jgi:hypothetical protein